MRRSACAAAVRSVPPNLIVINRLDEPPPEASREPASCRERGVQAFLMCPMLTGSLAVGYHSVQSPENNAAIMDGVRTTYDGPLAIARDLMVINVTKESMKVRMATVDEYVLPLDMADREAFSKRVNWEIGYSEFIANGTWDDVDEVLRPIYEDASKTFGRDFPYPENTE